MKSLVQYSKTFKSSSNVSFKEARTTSVTEVPDWCACVQCGVDSSYHCCVVVTKLLQRTLKALRFVEKINGEAASSNKAGANGA